ncbi:MAG: GDSL-type esterase/lipase family protein [Oscillospiraceae bacterium]
MLTDSDAKSLICYGDSITAQAWPDFLMERAYETSCGKAAVIRRAACGTRILRQYDNITYNSYGLKGDIRFPRECSAYGAENIIIQHGINDIIHPVGTDVNKFRPWSDLPTVGELTDGLKYYIDYAHKKGLNVYLGTLLPIEGWRTYADFREEIRCGVNEWILGNNEAEGHIDFAKAVCDENRPSKFAEGFDSGDHLHPSIAAYKKMAETVPDFLISMC